MYSQGGPPPPPPGYPPPPAGYGGPPPQGAYAVPQGAYGAYPPPQPYAYGAYGAGPSAAAAKPPKPRPPGWDAEAAAAAAYGGAFADAAVRAGFVRRVFLLVFCQLAITVGVACVFMFVHPVKDYVRGNSWVFIVAWVLSLVLIIAISCSTTLRRRHPVNLLALLAFTLAMAAMVGSVCAYYDVALVLGAFATTAAVVGAVALVALLVPFDMTQHRQKLFYFGAAFFVVSFVTFLIGFFWYSRWWYLVISCVGALLFTFFLLHDIQEIVGNGKHKMDPDEHVFAALQVYMDCTLLFLYILSIFGLARS